MYHIAIFEVKCDDKDRYWALRQMNNLRRAKNELITDMNKKLEQMFRTKEYKYALKEYRKAKKAGDCEYEKEILAALQIKYDVTWDYCRVHMQYLAKKYNVKAVFGLTGAEDVWRGIEKVLYSDGRKLNFKKFGDLPCLRTK